MMYFIDEKHAYSYGDMEADSNRFGRVRVLPSSRDNDRRADDWPRARARARTRTRALTTTAAAANRTITRARRDRLR